MLNVRITRGGLYNRSNPPGSLEVANTRIDDLNTEIEYIENSIEFSSPKPNQTEHEYQTWVQRAVSALSYFKTERTYLISWCIQSQLGQPGLTQVDSIYTGCLAHMETEVRTFLSSKEAQYVELYSYSRPEPSISEAISRRAELNKVMDILDKKGVHLRNLAFSKKIQSRDWKVMQRSIEHLKSRIKVEQRYLRPLVKRADRSGPVAFLLGLLERAVSEGFKMTSEETSQFKALQK
jgi:hypothetical protein